MSNVFLGSEIIVMSVEDARRLIAALFKVRPSKEEMKELQRLGILNILMDLHSAVKRHDAEVEDV